MLGSCLLSEAAIEKAAEYVEPSHFYRDTHGTIFAAMLAMHRRGDPVDGLLLSGELQRLGVLEKVGGSPRIAELTGLVPAASNVGHYAALVLEAATSRNLLNAALEIQRASLNGGVAMHPEVADAMQVALDAARILPGEPQAPRGPMFISAHDFSAREFAPPEPLMGTDELPIIAVGSFNLLAGRPGAGKTTTLLDMACHLAAGVPWPPSDGSDKAPKPWPVPRALRIGLIENEGPQESFRGKLERKLKHFPHSIRESGGCLLIQTLHWGSFSFADRSITQQMREELDAHDIDLVMGDPLASLGLEGVGSPKETLDFVQLLRPLGLGQNRAFLFLHHFRENVEKGADELQKISGAWGGHLDTLMGLASTHSADQLRLSYPKVRWAQIPEPKPVILGKVYNIAGFEAIAEEGEAVLLEPAIYQALSEARASGIRKGWMHIDELQEKLTQRPVDIRKALTGSDLFAMATGDQALALGAERKTKKFWGLKEWGEHTPAKAEQEATESLEDVAEPQDSFPDSGEDGIPF